MRHPLRVVYSAVVALTLLGSVMPLAGAADWTLAATVSPAPSATDSPSPSISVSPSSPPTANPSATAGMVSPSGAKLPAETRQVVEVTAATWHSTHATAVAWQYGPSGWQRLWSMSARVGARGLVPAALRRQNSRTTPAGTFALARAFGRDRAPSGTRMDFRRVRANDYWVYDPRDPSTYNTWVSGRANAKWRLAWAEHLIEYRTQYRYGVVIDYNHAASPGRSNIAAGGGIFLHVSGPGATAGCVSVSRAHMVRLLRWLDPEASPHIAISVR